MRRILACLAIGGVLVSASAWAQKYGGTLTVSHIDSPPSPSIQEEATASVVIPFMPIYNNLVIFDQHVPQHSLNTIRPELATAWTWSTDGTALTFTLHDGVKWHDGKPFSSADVKCTWDMVSGLTPGKIRKSPRQAWWTNLKQITVNGPAEVTFHLKRRQPSFLALLAAGWSPVYPCHIPSAQMRTKPIGTGPFRFVEYRLNESMKLERNPDYWKKGLPYLDAIEYKIVPNRATRMLGFIAGTFDMTYPTDVLVPLLGDIRQQDPKAHCEMRRTNVNVNLIINRDAPPFDNPQIRRALALAIDRKAANDIINEGQGRIGGSMLPPPEGVWGMPDEVLHTLTGYGPDVGKNRAEARAIMTKLGYGPDNMLKTKIFTRNINTFRDPALIMNDQLKQIFIDAELDVVDTPQYYSRVFKKDYAIGVNQTGSSLDDPDQNFYENYACGSLRNYTNYCNPALEKEFEAQSMETDVARRKAMVWDIERRLADDVVRPIIYHDVAAACWHPYVMNMTIMVNSIYNGWRWEDVWLDK
ncbi:MAG TPA: peptide ABC transporter substrate-binding protein [Acetobacteraceae bacterium]|jgi:peptide/nickel transport system substrate-binding protein|nr:peptide ABC transporter substrate-binding protein [Acetobacteraceae bacterium]